MGGDSFSPFLGDFMSTMKKKDISLQKEADARLVTGRFVFTERPGQVLSFPYRKYKGDPIKIWTFKDNEVYTIPRGIASHLQRTGRYAEHTHALDENGKPSIKIGKMITRYTFESLGFLDEDDESKPELYTAEIVPEKKIITK